jgi:hypothetical protein
MQLELSDEDWTLVDAEAETCGSPAASCVPALESTHAARDQLGGAGSPLRESRAAPLAADEGRQSARPLILAFGAVVAAFMCAGGGQANEASLTVNALHLTTPPTLAELASAPGVASTRALVASRPHDIVALKVRAGGASAVSCPHVAPSLRTLTRARPVAAVPFLLR